VLAAKFEITKDKAGKFRFHLKAPNGEIIAASQSYETKASAEKGVHAITPGSGLRPDTGVREPNSFYITEIPRMLR
jgi:uncharacterized protein YegP (UPF0339 family)